MSGGGTSLPAGFEALEPFADSWAIPTTAGRAQRRSDSSEDERLAFYGAAKDLLAPALELLDRKRLSDFDPAEQRLMDLMLSLAHVSLAVESQGPEEERHAAARQHMRITRASADYQG